MSRRVVCIGECMIEVAADGNGRAAIGFGGDTLNTAAYIKRFGITVDYATAIGDDTASQAMVAGWTAEGIGTGLVARCAGQAPGLYLINTDASGERTFLYWRDNSPARKLFDLPEGAAIARSIATSDVAYFSGITLSVLTDSGRAELHSCLTQARTSGAWIVFDGNFRKRGWADIGLARAAFERFLPLVTHALPTFDDERTLFGDADVMTTIRRHLDFGCAEVVVKQGNSGATVASSDRPAVHVPVPVVVQPVDTTGAGDSFNAGYVAGRLAGFDMLRSVRQGHRLAAVVIAHRGAIAPKTATAGVCAAKQ